MSDEVSELKARIRDLETILGQHNNTVSAVFHLPRAPSRLLGLLLSVPHVSADTISQRLGIATDPKVAIHRLRRLIKSYGIEIKSRRTFGYWIEPADKQRIRELLQNAEQSAPSVQ